MGGRHPGGVSATWLHNKRHDGASATTEPHWPPQVCSSQLIYFVRRTKRGRKKHWLHREHSLCRNGCDQIKRTFLLRAENSSLGSCQWGWGGIKTTSQEPWAQPLAPGTQESAQQSRNLPNESTNWLYMENSCHFLAIKGIQTWWVRSNESLSLLLSLPQPRTQTTSRYHKEKCLWKKMKPFWYFKHMS